jgi:hypothetical protein
LRRYYVLFSSICGRVAPTFWRDDESQRRMGDPAGLATAASAGRVEDVRFLIRDRDAKSTGGFDEVVRTDGVEVILTPFRSPRPTRTPSALSGPYVRSAWTGC